MALRKLGGLFLLATVASSMAIEGFAPPVARHESQPCEYYGECEEVEIFGYRVQRLVNSTAAAIQGRAAGKTTVDIGQDRIRQETVSFQNDPPPAPVFKELWDKILEACYQATCDREKTITVGDYSLNVDGQFNSVIARNNFVNLIRQTFDQSVTSGLSHSVIQVPGPGGPGGGGGGSGSMKENLLSTSGVHFINANIFGGSNSGQHMTVRVTRSAAGTNCPDAVHTIKSAGALVPGLAEFFGVIDLVCNVK
ncbi:hypothetical protein V492_03603 [Pseudogymnoascus sp. VKM F-4246]|nr:hypothetical protein V492_03603 [Pseudogymnoascus sp. VKM F-4246]